MTDKNNSIPLYKIVFSIFYVLMFSAVIFIISGDFLWVEGWIFSILFFVSTMINLLYLYFKDPDLLAERFRISGSKGQKWWDKYFLFIMTIMYFVWFIIIPLDAKRFAWTVNFPFGLKILGLILFIAYSILLFKSFADNTFTSPMVKIQKNEINMSFQREFMV
jgi:hypothetical protein